MGNDNRTYWSAWHNAAWAIFLVAMPIMAWFLPNSRIGGSPLHIWWLFMAGFILILFITGHGITGSWKGALIDNRNVIALSRFQMLAWTILVLSAFGSAVFWNVHHNRLPDGTSCLSDTKNGCLPGLPETLWLLMGISTASLVGSPLILSAKKNQRPNREELQRTFELLSQQGYNKVNLGNEGHLVVNAEPKQARWSDLFTGEETGNFAQLDPARLQMFFFTLVSLMCYGVLIGHRLEEAATSLAFINKFPVLNEGLLALIAISHTGYMAAKASQNSQTAIGAAPGTAATSGSADNDHPAVG